MLLDFVLSEPDAEWFATEADKVALFTERFGVPPSRPAAARLRIADRRGRPHRRRYFPHKLPIAVAGDPPVVHFVYLATDGTASRPSSSSSATTRRLLGALAGVDRRRRAPDPPAAVARACRGASSSASSTVDASRRARACQRPRCATSSTRRAVERDELAQLSVADLDRFRAARRALRRAR